MAQCLVDTIQFVTLATANADLGLSANSLRVADLVVITRSRTRNFTGELTFENVFCPPGRSILRKLYNLCISRVQEQIRGCHNLLLVPEGPMCLIPWAALMDRFRFIKFPFESVLFYSIF